MLITTANIMILNAIYNAVSKSQPVKDSTIGFNEAGYNDAIYAKAVAEHLVTEHTKLYVQPSDLHAL